MRIAVVTSQVAVNSVYRALPLLQLTRLGHAVRLDFDAKAAVEGALHDADVVHIHRYHDHDMRQAAQALRDAGVALVWDNDDDLVDSPARVTGALRSQQLRTQMAAAMQLAHVVTTTSEVLAAQYRAWGAEEVHVVENYIPDDYVADAQPHDGTVTIGWTAAREHAYDLKQLDLRTTLERLLGEHPQLRVVGVGLDLGLDAPGYRHQQVVQYEELGREVAAFDIGIAPIVDIPFNRARSNVKVKEYAAAGVPWLASPIGPYAGMGEREGGRLVADDRWHEELTRLVTGKRARRQLAKRGSKWGERQRVRRNLGRWEAVMQRAVDRAHELRAVA
jgi:glycosyltransferase involved in cell wall biosynthesis